MLCQFPLYSKVNQLCVFACISLRPPWTVALQAPLSMEFSWPESWSGLPFPAPESAICMSIPHPPPFQTPIPFRSPQSTEQSSLCYAVGSHQLSTLYVVTIVYICQSQSPNLSPFPFPLITISLFSTSVTPLLFCR